MSAQMILMNFYLIKILQACRSWKLMNYHHGGNASTSGSNVSMTSYSQEDIDAKLEPQKLEEVRSWNASCMMNSYLCLAQSYCVRSSVCKHTRCDMYLVQDCVSLELCPYAGKVNFGMRKIWWFLAMHLCNCSQQLLSWNGASWYVHVTIITWMRL